MNVGSLTVDLSVSISKFHRALSEIVGRVSRLGSEMERSFGPKPREEIDKTEERFERFTWTVRGHIKDMSRVATGIIMAQSFYNTLNAIEGAAYALGRFNADLQEAQVSFELLLGSAEEAKGFLSALEDFTAKTPLLYEQSLRIATQMKAMGFHARSVIPVMKVLVDAATVRGGGPDVIEGLARALGQILTKGKAEYEEMMQLAERGIPFAEILREELGLTADQIRNLGKQAIPAKTIIRALLVGMEKRYGGAAERINRTTRGLVSNIHDNLMFLGNMVFAPVFESIRKRLEEVTDRLQGLRDTARKFGLGGLFQALFPPRLQGTIKSVIVGLKGLVEGLVALRDAFKPIAAAVGELILRTMAIVLPVLAALTKVLGELAKWLTSNVPLVRHLVGAIAAFVVTGAVLKLLSSLALTIKALLIAGPAARAITFLKDAILALHAAMVRSPIIGLITLATAALLGLALSSQTASRWLDHVMQKIGRLLGINIDKALEPTAPQDISKWLQEYNQSLGEAVQNLEGVGDSAEGSGKKLKKFLAAFDEVYQIPEEAEDAGLGDLEDFLQIPPVPELPGLPGLDTSAAEDQITSAGEGLLDKLKRLLNELRERLSDQPPLIIPPPMFWPPLPAVAEAFEAFLERLRIMYAEATAGVREWVRRFAEELSRPIPLPSLQPVRDWVERWRENLERGYQQARDWIGRLKETLGQIPLPSLQPVFMWVSQFADTLKLLPQVAAEQFETFKQRAWEGLSAVANFFNEHKGIIIGILAAIAGAVAIWLLGLPATVVAAASAFIIAVGTMFADAKTAAAAELEQTKQQVSTKWEQIRGEIDIKLAAIKQRVFNWWAQIKQDVATKLEEIWTDVTTWWSEMKKSIGQIMDEIWQKVTTTWEDLKTTVLTTVQKFVSDALGKWEEFKTSLGDIWNSIRRTTSDIWDEIKETIRGKINYIINLINKFIRAFNNIKIRVPKITIPFVGTFGGFTISVPQIPELPTLDAGAIVTEDTIARLAGNNRPEAVIPLTGEAAKPFAEMIAEAIASVLPESAFGPPPQPVYVGTLIADERSLKELARRIEIINLREATRKGGRIG